jgi:SWI/SNF-related matrix-associated actin-dependent regulator of chromatin subfamily D
VNVNAKIILNLDHNPQKFKLSPALADLLDVKIETKPQIVMGIWNYCKVSRTSDPTFDLDINDIAIEP